MTDIPMGFRAAVYLTILIGSAWIAGGVGFLLGVLIALRLDEQLTIK